MVHTEIHAFKVGSFERILIKDIDHMYKNPAVMMFSNAPHRESEEVLGAFDIELTEWHEYRSPYPRLLVKTGSHHVLIDTGIGTTFPPDEGLLMQELTAILVEPEGVDHVLITHAHADQPLVHCFHVPFPGLGYIRERDDGYRWEPLFRGDFDPD